jgi:choline dehydrogenase-like flavoprotein
MPAAESQVPVAERAGRLLDNLPARSRRQVGLGIQAFERLPFPWRFSRLRLEDRKAYLREMDAAATGLRRDLLLLLKLLTSVGYAGDERVRAAVGFEPACGLAEGQEPSPPSSLGDLEPQLPGEDCDVVVVGSGAGGATAASVLAEAGLDVIVLEAGPHLDRRSYPEELVDALGALYRDGGMTVAEGRPAVPLPVGRCVGGTTVINSGTCFRAPDHVLAVWREESGIDWATELEAEYEAAERFLAVTPVDPATMGRNGQLLMEGAQALGLSHGPISRNAGDCRQCSSCPTGCRLDAKRAMHVSYLPRAVAAGARIRSGVEVRRVLVEGGRAVGVACEVAPDGGTNGGRPARYEVRAKAVVAAGGALGTPELLLRSGIANGSGQVGRNLRIHPACWVGARYHEEVRGWDGVMQSYYVDEWHDRGLLLEATFTPLAFGAPWLPGVAEDHQRAMLAYDRVASIGVHLHDRSRGRVWLAGDGSLRIGYRLTSEDAKALQFGIARTAEIHFAAGAHEVYPQTSGHTVLRPGGAAAFDSAQLKPSDLRLEAFHPMGTARMGSDPSQSVVGPDGRSHDVDGLYVADAALFPSSLGVNPMMTVIACASRVGKALADRLA